MDTTKLLCDYCNKQIDNTIWNIFQENEDLRDLRSYTCLFQTYEQAEDSQLCKALIHLCELLETDTCDEISDIPFQSLERLVSDQRRSRCTIVHAFQLCFKKINIECGSRCKEKQEFFEKYWNNVKEIIVSMIQQKDSLPSPSQREELIELIVEALKCNVDKDGYTTLLNCFSVSSMPTRRILLEKIRQLDLNCNFVASLIEKIFHVIQELIGEQDMDELFLFNFTSDDDGTCSNSAMLHACFRFMIDTLVNIENPQELVQDKLAFVANGLTPHLRESYDGPNQLMMNTFADWMAQLIGTIFERLQLETLAPFDCSEPVQELIIRAALSPLPLTATELNVQAFHYWLYLLSNNFSDNLFSMNIVDTSTGASVNAFVAAFDVACNDVDHRVRIAALKVVMQALVLRNRPNEVVPVVVDNTKSILEYSTCRNDLLKNIISTSVAWPNSADELATSFACLALTFALICNEECREAIIDNYSSGNQMFFHRLLDFVQREIPDNIVQHLLYLISACLAFSESCRKVLTDRMQCLNKILDLATSENTSLTRGLAYVVVSFFLGSGCQDSTLTEYETKLRSYKVQFRRDLMYCLDKGENTSSSCCPLGTFRNLLSSHNSSSSLSSCFDVIREHWSHLFRNALITLETVPLQFAKFSETVSSSDFSSIGNAFSWTGQDWNGFPDKNASMSSSLSTSPRETRSESLIDSFVDSMKNVYSEQHIVALEQLHDLPTTAAMDEATGEDARNSFLDDTDMKTDLSSTQISNEKFDELCARLETVAKCMEEASIVRSEQRITAVGIESQQKGTNHKYSRRRQVVFHNIFSLPEGDCNSTEQPCSNELLLASLENVQWNERQMATTVEDYVEMCLDEMEQWYESSVRRLNSHFQKLSALEGRVGKATEILALSHFQYEEEELSLEKHKGKSFRGTVSPPMTSYESNFLEERRKRDGQVANDMYLNLKHFVDGEFQRWCNYLQDEVQSRMSENAEILGHLQMQIYNMKRTCSEQNQLEMLLTLLLRHKTAEWQDRKEEFVVDIEELDWIHQKLSGQRPLVALVSLCVFLREYLDIARKELQESNEYVFYLQNETKSMKDVEPRDLAQRRIKQLILQKDKIYSLLDEFGRRWQQHLVKEFPEDEFPWVVTTKEESSVFTRDRKNPHYSLDQDDNLLLLNGDTASFCNNAKQHEKLLLRALKVNNSRIEKLVKLSLQRGGVVARNEVTASQQRIVSSDYRKLQKEHKILLAALAELHREYRYLASE